MRVSIVDENEHRQLDGKGLIKGREPARAGIRRNERVVIEAALAAASAKDREFPHAMSIDDGPSTTANIIHRTGSRPTLIAKYRNRLLDSGLIESTGHGKDDYAIPGLREYLRRNPNS